MKASEFQKAFEIAESDAVLISENIEMFDGFGLPDFQPVVATYRQLAYLMRWQACQLNGKWDTVALTEIKNCLRKKLTLVEA